MLLQVARIIMQCYLLLNNLFGSKMKMRMKTKNKLKTSKNKKMTNFINLKNIKNHQQNLMTRMTNSTKVNTQTVKQTLIPHPQSMMIKLGIMTSCSNYTLMYFLGSNSMRLSWQCQSVHAAGILSLLLQTEKHIFMMYTNLP